MNFCTEIQQLQVVHQIKSTAGQLMKSFLYGSNNVRK